jgi:hypothetical protein
LSSKKEENIIVCLAYFVRYGYFALAILVICGLSAMGITKNIIEIVFFIMSTLYGMYHLLGTRFEFKHLYCSLQNAYHQKMTPNTAYDFSWVMKRDAKFIGYIFIAIGILGILAVYKGF